MEHEINLLSASMLDNVLIELISVNYGNESFNLGSIGYITWQLES